MQGEIGPAPAAADRAVAGEDPAARPLVTLGELLCAAESRLTRVAEGDAAAVADAFLDAAGIAQVLEDRAVGELWRTGRVQARLAAQRAPVALAAPVAGALAPVALELGEAGPTGRAVRLAGRRWAALADQLAGAVLAPLTDGSARAPGALAARVQRELDATRALAARGGRGREVRRPPSCFMVFDQHPADVLHLVERFAREVPQRARPLVVAGLRTSGSYLAPLAAAALRALGYGSVSLLSLRPGQPIRLADARVLARHAAGGGLVLVIDDPPRSGVQMREAADALRRATGREDTVVLLVPLLAGPDRVRAALEAERAIYLPFEDWRVHAALRAPRLTATLGAVLGARLEAVEDVELLPVRRGHAAARVRVRLRGDGGAAEAVLCAEGAGFGYFGERARLIAERLGDFAPTLHGARDGLLIRDWLPDHERLDRAPAGVREAAPAALASYVCARAARLPLPEDLSAGLVGRDAMPEVVAGLLARAFGGARLAMRAPMLALARRLLRVQAAASVDGAMGLERWFAAGAADGGVALRKGTVARQAYSDSLVASADPVLDLATAAAGFEALGADRDGARVRAEYERQSGRPVGEERWLLYRLVDHLTAMEDALRRAAAPERVDVTAFAQALARERAGARAYQRWIASTLLAGALGADATGPLCGIDVDGVLETRWADVPVMAPAAAVALARLHAHGRRAVVVTGRCLGEVVERCRSYGLAGGVAEYGSAIWEAGARRATSLLEPVEYADLARLRAALAARPRVVVDGAHRHSVRAFELRADGRRRALPDDVLDGAIAECGLGDRVRVVQGTLQSDVVAASADKASGVRALAERLGTAGDSERPLELAIGDAPSDMPFLGLAAHAFAPANASFAAPPGVRRLRQGYGAALLAAAGEVLGCGRRGCAVCRRAAPPAPDAAALLDVLRALDGGPPATLGAAARVVTGGRLQGRRSRAPGMPA